MKPAFNLGAWRYLDGNEGGHALWLPAAHLVTHGVVVGMTGSGKTGLLMVMIEEALRNEIRTLVIIGLGFGADVLKNIVARRPANSPAPAPPA